MIFQDDGDSGLFALALIPAGQLGSPRDLPTSSAAHEATEFRRGRPGCDAVVCASRLDSCAALPTRTRQQHVVVAVIRTQVLKVLMPSVRPRAVGIIESRRAQPGTDESRHCRVSPGGPVQPNVTRRARLGTLTSFRSQNTICLPYIAKAAL
jgi:hypothetical protein